jgi:hypothetical protein
MASLELLRLQQNLSSVDHAIVANRSRKLVQRDWREEGVLRLQLIDLMYRRQALLRQTQHAQQRVRRDENCP